MFSIIHPGIRASVIEGLRGLYFSISAAKGNPALQEYSQVVHQTIEDNGYSIQLEDVLFYEDRVEITAIAFQSDKEREIRGNWDFAFRADGYKLLQAIHKITINQQIPMSDWVLDVLEIRLNPDREFELVMEEKMNQIETPLATTEDTRPYHEPCCGLWTFHGTVSDEMGNPFVCKLP